MTPDALLIVRLGALGDVVHAMPVVAALHEAWPSMRIGWLVQAAYADLVARVHGVGRVHAVRARLDLATLREVRQVGYAVCLDLQGLMKSAAYARFSGAPRVIGFSRGLLREPLAALAYNETGGTPGGHIIEQNLSLLGRLGLTPPPAPVVALDVPPSAVVSSTQALVGGAGVRFALLNPGAGWPNKRWPPERFGELADALHAAHDLRSVVLWGPGEASLAAAAVRGSARQVAVMAPQSSMVDVLALARAAAVVVAGDTGPLHLAAAVSAPVVGLYGPTPAGRNGPWRADDEVVSRHDVCACTFKRTCLSSSWCLETITVHEVAEAVGRRLATATAQGGA